MAPPCLRGGVVSVVVAVELPVPADTTLSTTYQPLLLRSDICGSAAGHLTYETKRSKPIYKVPSGKTGRQTGKIMPQVSGQLKLSYTAAVVKRTNSNSSSKGRSSPQYIDESSDDNSSSIEKIKSSTSRIRRINSEDGPQDDGDHDDPFERLSTSASSAPGGDSSVAPHSCVKAKKRRVVLDDDDEDNDVDMENSDNSATNNVRNVMIEALQCLESAPNVEDFMHPVTAGIAPDYADIISNPMDISEIRSKLENGAYDSALNSFIADVNLIWRNCYEYNGTKAAISAVAKKLAILFDSTLKAAATKYNVVYNSSNNTPVSTSSIGMESNQDDTPAEGTDAPSGDSMVVIVNDVEHDVTIEIDEKDDVETSFEKEVLPFGPCESVLDDMCKEAESNRDIALSSTHLYAPQVGQEYQDDSPHSAPVRVSGPWCLLTSSNDGKHCMDTDTLAAHRGSVAALETLSSLHDTWCDAEVFSAYANMSDATDDTDIKFNQERSAPIADRLFAADLSSFIKTDLMNLEHNTLDIDGKCTEKTNTKKFIAKYIYEQDFATASTTAIQLQKMMIDTGAEVSGAGCDSGSVVDSSSSSSSDDDKEMGQEDSSDEDVATSKNKRKNNKRRLSDDSSSDDEAEFDDGNSTRYGARNSRGIAVNSGNGSMQFSSVYGVHGDDTTESSGHAVEGQSMHWRLHGTAHIGYLRHHSRRAAYAKYMTDVCYKSCWDGTCNSSKGLAFDIDRRNCNGIDNNSHFKQKNHIVHKTVATDVVPLISRMLEAEVFHAKNNDILDGAGIGSSSRRSSRGASGGLIKKKAYPYVGRVTALSDDILSTILQFGTVGAPHRSQNSRPAAWD